MQSMKKFIFGTLIASSILFLLVLPLGQDMWYHMYRIGAMAEELQQAPFRLPIRMLSATYNGYGYGAALYYGDLFLYPFAFLAAAGADVVWVYKLLTVCIWWTTFGVACFSVKRMGEKQEDSMLFAYFYTFSSCCALNLCIRSAIGESLAMAFLPLVFCSFYGLIKEKKGKDWLWLALGMTAVALSHMLTLLWCVIILAIWALWKGKEVFAGGKWLEILKAALMMLALSASFLFPMLEQMLYQKVQTPTNSEYQKQAFLDYGIEWMDYFVPYEVKKALTVWFNTDWNIEFWHPGTIGLFALLLLLFVIFLKKRRKLQLSPGLKLLFCLSLFTLLALGITPWMKLAREVLAFMQFSWRILPFITLGLALTGKGIVQLLSEKKGAAALLLGTFLIFCLAIGPRYLYQIYVQRGDYQYIQENNPDYYHKYQYAYDPNAADCLYLPAGVWGGLYLERGEAVEADQEGVEFTWKRNPGEITVEITKNPHSRVVLELPLFMYKGYTAKTLEGDRLEVAKTRNGLVGVEAGGRTGSFTVSYEGTWLQKLSDIVTIIAIMGMAYHFYRRRRRKQ